MAGRLALVGSTATPVTVRQQRPVGQWLALPGAPDAQQRARRGLARLDQYLYQDVPGVPSLRADRLLSGAQLWEIYWKTPDIRASVDSIVRRVATWDWGIEVAMNPKEPAYADARRQADGVERFLGSPNADQTWQELCTAWTTDLLVYEFGVLEKVRSRGGDLVELVARTGDDFTPIRDRYGSTSGWRQEVDWVSETAGPTFEAKDLVMLHLFPNTRSPFGRPLIESLVNEVVTLLVASENVMLTLDADEIPPGLLVLGGLGKEAMEAAKADFQQKKGRDNKIRILGSPDRGALTVEWKQLKRSLKDVDFMPVIEWVQRRVWRTFGVMPIEMGSEEATRAHASAQMDVSESHLTTPILETIQAKVNRDIVPEMVDPALLGVVRFRFDRDSRLDPLAERAIAEVFERYVRQGIMTRNEIRKERGLLPIDGGDVATVEFAQGLIDVSTLAGVGAPDTTGDDPEEPEEPEDPDGGEGGPDDPEVDDPPAPDKAKSVVRRGLVSDPDLPSDWQAAGRFADVRTLDLPRLGVEVVGYARDVLPLWRQAQRETVAAFLSAWDGEPLTDDGAAALRGRVTAAVDSLLAGWGAVTLRRYVAAVRVGRDAVATFSGQDAVGDPEVLGASYHSLAMGYLNDRDGLVGQLRDRLLRAVGQLQSTTTGGRATPAPGGHQHHDGCGCDVRSEDDFLPLGPTPRVDDELAAAVSDLFLSQEHRVDNWSGKLLDVGNGTLIAGLIQASSERGSEERVTWWCEWVAVGDRGMCSDCEYEGSAGFRPLAALTRRPGGDTRCGARCRCVLVLWTEAEVTSGDAVSLSLYDT